MAVESYEKMLMNQTESYMFPALRGVQAGREYYVAMCPMMVIPKIFLYDEGEVPAKLRAQRTLNKARIPEMARYLTENSESYVFSSITASIDSEYDFVPYNEAGTASKMGTLVIPMDARVLINDGQHRRAAIEKAIRENRELAKESISVVFYIDAGLKRSQQMFADLNQHAVRGSKSLEILYDHREEFSQFVIDLVESIPVFKRRTEMEKTSISNRSKNVFTLSGIYRATKALLGKGSKYPKILEVEKAVANEFWLEVSNNIPEWQMLIKNQISSQEIRRDYVHAQGVVLQSLGHAGEALIKTYPKVWKKKLKILGKIDWSRLNTAMWEGRTMHQGKIRKARNNIVLTTNILKQQFGLSLNEKEQEIEDQFIST